MKKRQAAYWKERFSILNQASAEYGQAVYVQIERAFTEAQRDIQRDIDAWYARFAGNNGITLPETKKLLNSRELSELKWDIGQYIKYGKQNALDGKWAKQLENASARFHITRLEALQLRTQQALEKAFGNELDAVDGMIRRTVTNDYYRTAFELQRGVGVGFDIGEISSRELDGIVKKPWTTDGRTFSDRIWAKKQQMIGDLHNELTRCCIYGRSQKDAIARLEQYVDKNVKNAKYCARRIVVTEQAYFSSRSQYDALKELNVVEYEIDLPTTGCDICREMNGKHFPISAYEVGSTAPPFHPNCENGGIIPYFDDNEFALPDGKETKPLSEDTSFEEWERKFVKGEGLTNGGDGGIMKTGSDNMALEFQRYGRNKNTLVNKTYINSGEYRRKFDNASNNPAVNKSLYDSAKKALKHRSGTELEDMYWFDGDTGSVIYSALDNTDERAVEYTEKIKRVISKNSDKKIITLHTHPNSMPPSIEDFNSCFKHGYHSGYVVCHNGRIFRYMSHERVSTSLYELYIQKFLDDGLDEYNAQLKALEKIAENHAIEFEEVL